MHFIFCAKPHFSRRRLPEILLALRNNASGAATLGWAPVRRKKVMADRRFRQAAMAAPE
jgi:hypothetical protein